MEVKLLARRNALKFLSGTAVTLALTKGAAAQIKLNDPLLDIVLDILPEKQESVARTIRSILALEARADQKQLPRSILALDNQQPLEMQVAETSLYQAALPRLVTLIDRSETSDPGVADEAGKILADVHATQHEVPEALKTEIPAAQPAPTPLSAPKNDASIAMLRSTKFAVLKDEYRRLFESLTVRDEYATKANWHLAMMRKSRSRYELVGNSVSVPWYFIAVIHALEASFNFRAHLHNGDYPLSARTRQVPAGHPKIWLPPDDWASSAKDALKLLRFTGQSDWSLERILYRLEAYNGFGYRRTNVPTPYLWSLSTHYERGKFVADGSFSLKAKSQQCGAAVMLKLLIDAGDVKLS
jgi:lysozyme family protein